MLVIIRYEKMARYFAKISTDREINLTIINSIEIEHCHTAFLQSLCSNFNCIIFIL
jgi:hypothetical protein